MVISIRNICLSVICLCLFACNKETERTFVTINTSEGDFTVFLYDDTPLHKENFIKLCSEHAYDSTIFHRVIKDFVIQGGDPSSKARIPGALYGENSGGYTVPAEILTKYYNKKGALIDAKDSDDRNPLRASAGTQFCIVQGHKYTDKELEQTEKTMKQWQFQWMYYKAMYSIKQENPTIDSASLDQQARKLGKEMYRKQGIPVIPPSRKYEYKTTGGAAHLDGMVTIFGEISEGQDIVEKITLMQTDTNDRPIKDVLILSTKVFTKNIPTKK